MAKAVAKALCASVALLNGGLAAQQVEPPFAHFQHVSQIWLVGEIAEVARDCRGCHRFEGNGRGASAPQGLCRNCHLNGPDTITENEWKSDLRQHHSRRSEVFFHSTHLELECRECHAPEPGQDRRLVKHLPIRPGIAECARCHGKDNAPTFGSLRWLGGEVPVDISPQSLRQVFQAKINERITESARLPFLHEHHLEAWPDIGDSLQCAGCHDLRDSDAVNLATTRFAPSACADCHIGEDAKLNVLASERTRASPSANTFSHADHLRRGETDERVATSASYERIATQTCGACHVPAGETSRTDYDFAGPPSIASYEGCITCHDIAGRKTRRGLHGHWHEGLDGHAACTSCHDFGTGAMRTTRPMVGVTRRPTGGKYRFTLNPHPHVSGTGRRRQEAEERTNFETCRDCHKTDVSALPSRIAAPFRHDVHLPPVEPEKGWQQDCLRCHTQADSAPTSAALTVSEMRTYSLEACADCHWGSALEKSPPSIEMDSDAAERAVPEFSHESHMGEGADCGDCHEQPSPESPIGYLDDVLNCRRCHDHNEHAERTGGIRAAEVESCKHCHKSVTGGEAIPKTRMANDPLEVAAADYLMLDGLQSAQFHPLPGAQGARTCSDCHVETEAPRKAEDHIAFTERAGGKTHIEGKDATPNCLGCHWKRGSAEGLDLVDIRNATHGMGARDPESPRNRADFGNLLTGYPGTDAERASGR